MMQSNSTFGDGNLGVQIGALVDSSGKVFKQSLKIRMIA